MDEQAGKARDRHDGSMAAVWKQMRDIGVVALLACGIAACGKQRDLPLPPRSPLKPQMAPAQPGMGMHKMGFAAPRDRG